MPYALGGARLEGSSLVRIAYIDESGTNPRDHCLVVAGIVVHGDDQLIPVEDYMLELVEKHIPAPDREGFVFHAADIWNNNNYFRDKELWPWERRSPILWDLVRIPAKFTLPIAFGFKAHGDPLPEGLSKVPTAEELDVATHAIAFMGMTVCLERFMRSAFPHEAALLTVEDRPKAKTVLKQMHALLRDRAALARYDVETEALPLVKVRDTTHFAAKTECRHLQIADVCAYFIRGFMAGNYRHAPFHNVLRPMMIDYPKHEQWPALEWPLGPLVPLWEESLAERNSELGRLRILLRGQRAALRNAVKRHVE